MLMPDVPLVFALYAVKLWRAMVLWICLYVVEKVYQDEFVHKVLAGDGDARPPSLSLVIAYAVGAEAVAMLLLVAVLALLMAKYKTRDSTFVIDNRFMVLLFVDYALTTSTMVTLGVAVAKQVQDGRLFRYRDDGLRGIRALCTLLLQLSAVVLALPVFCLVS